MPRRAVVLLSGGLDSGTALALWLHQGHSVEVALTMGYGQASAEQEWQAAAGLARRFGIDHESLPLPWLEGWAAQAGSALIPGAGALPDRSGQGEPGDASTAAAVWVPARNLLFLSIAAARAEATGADTILVGFNREEAETFADNSAAFVTRTNAALALATRSGVVVESPTSEMDKPAIVAAARELGLQQADFWSCYAAGDAPCQRCESCRRSARAWGC